MSVATDGHKFQLQRRLDALLERKPISCWCTVAAAVAGSLPEVGASSSTVAAPPFESMEPRLVRQAGHGCREDSNGTSLLLLRSLLREEVLLRRGKGGPKTVFRRGRVVVMSAVDLLLVKGVEGSSAHKPLPSTPDGRLRDEFLSPLGGASEPLLLAGGLFMETSKEGRLLEAARASASAAAASWERHRRVRWRSSCRSRNSSSDGRSFRSLGQGARWSLVSLLLLLLKSSLLLLLLRLLLLLSPPASVKLAPALLFSAPSAVDGGFQSRCPRLSLILPSTLGPRSKELSGVPQARSSSFHTRFFALPLLLSSESNKELGGSAARGSGGFDGGAGDSGAVGARTGELSGIDAALLLLRRLLLLLRLFRPPLSAPLARRGGVPGEFAASVPPKEAAVLVEVTAALLAAAAKSSSRFECRRTPRSTLPLPASSLPNFFSSSTASSATVRASE